MLIDTVEKFNTVKGDLLLCGSPAVDTETNGLNPWGTKSHEGHRIIGIAIYTGKNAYYFPYRHLQGTNLPMETMEFFRSYLGNDNRVYRGFNYKFDQHMLSQEGIRRTQNIEDAMLAVHLLNENEPEFGLKPLGDKYIKSKSSLEEGEMMDKLEVITKGEVPKKKLKGYMALLPPEDVEPYACQDVILTDALIEMAIPALKSWGLYDIWKEVNHYSNITYDMEHKGMLLDIDLIEKYQQEATVQVKEALDKLDRLANRPINPNSSKQVCNLLGINSSAAEVLEVLAERNDETSDVAKAVMGARGWISVGSRYYTPYLESADKENVLRTSLNLIGTISGRLSSSNPNLQAVARQTEVFKVKDVFISRPGYTMVSADYSQAEMRLACWYAKEELMSQRIREGLDIHGTTAADLNVTRDTAKRINFGVIYGIGKKALSDQLHIPEDVAADYLKRYHALYPQFRKLYSACEAEAERSGYIQMWTGRVRRYNESTPSHKAMSNLIQGGVAEIMRIAITKLYPIIKDMHGYMVLQIHDQIIAEIPDENLNMALEVIPKVMCDFSFDPPMKVDIKFGRSWGTMEKINKKEKKQ